MSESEVEVSLGGPDSVQLRQHALAGVAFSIAVALCLPALKTLSFLWEGLEYYGHAYALPLAAAYLAYADRSRIREALRDLRPPRFGFLVAFGAAALEVLTYMGDVLSVAGLGIPLVLGATAYALGGARLLRPLLLPLTFVALMVPPPQFVIYEMLFRLKLIVTDVTVWLLQAAGKTVMAEGNLILVPGHTLFVADACSGLTSVVTMIPIASIVAYFMSHGLLRRAVVIASVLPLAVGANIVRVAVTVWLVPSLGTEAAQGILHESFGVMTYVVGILALIGVARVLR